MDELKKLAQLRMEQDNQRKIENVEKPQFRLAIPGQQPTKLRTSSSPVPIGMGSSSQLPPIESLLPKEQMDQYSKNWENKSNLMNQMKQDSGASISNNERNLLAQNTHALPVDQVLQNLDEVPDNELENEVSDYLKQGPIKGQSLNSLNDYLKSRNSDLYYSDHTGRDQFDDDEDINFGDDQ